MHTPEALRTILKATYEQLHHFDSNLNAGQFEGVLERLEEEVKLTPRHDKLGPAGADPIRIPPSDHDNLVRATAALKALVNSEPVRRLIQEAAVAFNAFS